MRALRTLAALAVAGGFVVGVVWPAAAESGQPPKLDVDKAMAELADNQIYRAPGAVAYYDEAKVRAQLTADVKILVAPYTGENYPKDDQHLNEVYEPLNKWAEERKVGIVFVEGIYVTTYGSDAPGYGPANIPELRQTTAYLDVTAAITSTINAINGMDLDKSGQHGIGAPIPPVPPTQDELDDLASKLRDNPVYNAPGREDPVDPAVAPYAKEKYGLSVRIAAFPIVQPDERIVDYAPALAKLFPDDIIMVSYGRWLDVATAQQDKANSARDYAYGRFKIGSFTRGSLMTDRIGTVLERLSFLLKETAYGRPQPKPQPKPEPFDVRRTIAGLAPWVLVGSAVVLGGTGLVAWRRRVAAREEAEEKEFHRASATAMARIGELGARLLAVAERGKQTDPAAAERHTTARAMYDQALTAKAMAEVEKIADEGLALTAGEAR